MPDEFLAFLGMIIFMRIQYVTLDNCAEAAGTVVVIDVLRAFTVSAYALDAGAQEIILIGSVPEALVLHGRFPQSILMGEVDGLPIPEPTSTKYSGEIRVRMPPSLHQLLAQRASNEGVSLNQYMVAGLARAVGLDEGKKVQESRK